ncbi:thymidylate kinase [Pseudoalteromonas porphyrae]|uniref:Thymidylate kinase n=1 Tax=Pseudoalteromonas porphyrae TaxID=187330 RepID=A0A0N1EYZ3_9GAMM|nr:MULTISPECIES: dTMP kinase [Pseudoalteromonas]KPH64252.1 thymidylate kinase [Pseudoalteromonas porphyrae]KPH96084.1 thymidylate kinase [Pseudoalteromonas porphyrae]NMR24014.1 dTMP kinase [Pseudoalteromonas sp. NEC-BIFX-2020_015]
MTAAKFIVIEGLEGAGKSTAIAICQQFLAQHGVDFINVREPGGTPIAEALRSIVKDNHDEEIASETELLIMYAARSQLLHNVIRPAMAKGQWVLGDRHDLSSQAYQGGGREIASNTLDSLASIVLKGLKPDLTIYLDIDPAIGLARAKGRGELDRIEQQALSFFERTRTRYLELAKCDDSIETVNAQQSIERVHQDIITVLDQFIKSNH